MFKAWQHKRMYVTAQPVQPVIRLSAPMSTPAHHAGLLTSSLRRKVLILLAAIGCKYYYLTVFGAGQRAAESTQGMRERGLGGWARKNTNYYHQQYGLAVDSGWAHHVLTCTQWWCCRATSLQRWQAAQAGGTLLQCTLHNQRLMQGFLCGS